MDTQQSVKNEEFHCRVFLSKAQQRCFANMLYFASHFCVWTSGSDKSGEDLSILRQNKQQRVAFGYGSLLASMIHV